MAYSHTQKKRSSFPKPAAAAVLITVLVGIAVVAFLIGNPSVSSSSPEEVSAGIDFLHQKESLDTDEIDQVLAERRRARLIAEHDENIRRLEDESTDIWSLFTDYVIFGDSRSVSFSFSGMLSEDRVFADTGNLIWDAETSMDAAAALNPSYIFFNYGLNDIVAGIWDTYDAYVADYEEVLKGAQERFPDALIFVNSILLVKEPERSKLIIWEEIPLINDMLRQMCERDGFFYIDNDQICEEHWDLYQEDEKHLLPEFYPYWGKNMMRAVYDSVLKDAGVDTGSTGSSGDVAEEAGSAGDPFYSGETYEDAGYGTDEYGYTEYGTDEYGAAEYGTDEYGYTEYGTDEYGYAEYGTDEYGYTEYGTDGYGAAEYGEEYY